MSEESRGLKSVPTSETSSSEWDKSLGFLKAMFNGDKTYDNRTEEIQLSQRTTYRDWNHRVTGTVMLSERGRRASVTRAAVRMGVEGTGMRTRHKGASKWGPSRERAQRRGRRLWSNQRSVSIQ